MEIPEAQLASSYFWFLSGEPEMFDRIDTAHTPPGNWKPKSGRPKVDPGAIKPVRIRYYRNPLGRLVKLHQSYQEMSTASYTDRRSSDRTRDSAEALRRGRTRRTAKFCHSFQTRRD